MLPAERIVSVHCLGCSEYLYVCVCTRVCSCVHVQVHRCLNSLGHLEDNFGCQTFFFTQFEAGHLLLIPTYARLIACGFLGTLLSHRAALGLHTPHHILLSLCSRDLNPGPYICAANTLSTELLPCLCCCCFVNLTQASVLWEEQPPSIAQMPWSDCLEASL